jgi:hypothetical protein
LAYSETSVRLPTEMPTAREQATPARDSAPSVATSTVATLAAEAPTRTVLEATRDAGVSFFYALPCRVVGTCDSAPAQTLSARLADGSPLPHWLKFDANTATFFGDAPAQTRTVVVKVFAGGSDTKGNLANDNDNDNATTVTLKFLGAGTMAKR